MKIPRFYCPENLQTGATLTLPPEVHRHAVQVLRLKVDEPLILFNGEGGEYLAKITRAEKRHSDAYIERFDDIDRESPLQTTLALSLIKPDKMDFAIQKSVELGVNAIQPVVTDRSVIKIKNDKQDKKRQHWQGIIIAACEQSGRTRIPTIRPPIKLDDWLQQQSDALRIMMLPTAQKQAIDLPHTQNIELLIGPEGGFTDQEEDKCLQQGLETIVFGQRVFRAETAAIAGLSILQQRFGDL
jgi:16S rRNA (uracil1498-N3)-methyltransferase